MNPTARTQTTTTLPIPPHSTLLLALELSNKTWRLGFTVAGRCGKPRMRTIDASQPSQVADLIRTEISTAKKRFHLPETAPVLSCYEAGRDGFWPQRLLESLGVESLVIDSSSIEVKRRGRQAKTDRVDLGKLVQLLLRYSGGDRDAFRVVQVPSVADEDARHAHRELGELKQERTRAGNEIKGLLATQGVKEFSMTEPWRALQWDGSPLPPRLRDRLERLAARFACVDAQIREIDKERLEALKSSSDPRVELVRTLMGLRAVGINGAWLLTMEFFAWREFQNRRQVGSLAGLTGTPFSSGDGDRERGISKAGNRRVRVMMIELAWCWLRFQPQSDLSRWYQRRYGSGSKRTRRVGIVALARKLLVALWRYVDQGVVPEGALLKV